MVGEGGDLLEGKIIAYRFRASKVQLEGDAKPMGRRRKPSRGREPRIKHLTGLLRAIATKRTALVYFVATLTETTRWRAQSPCATTLCRHACIPTTASRHRCASP